MVHGDTALVTADLIGVALSVRMVVDDCVVVGRSQMEGMVLDLSLAKEKQQNFEAWQRQERRALPIDMTVQVLTTGFWPQYKVRLRRPRPPPTWLSSACMHAAQRMQATVCGLLCSGAGAALQRSAPFTECVPLRTLMLIGCIL